MSKKIKIIIGIAIPIVILILAIFIIKLNLFLLKGQYTLSSKFGKLNHEYVLYGVQ